MNKYEDIRKANETAWVSSLFIALASLITNFYTASRGVQSFEKAVRCQIFSTLFCLINGTGRASITASLSAQTTKISLIVQPFAAYGFWLSFAPEHINQKRQRGALSFTHLSDIATKFTEHRVQLNDRTCITKEQIETKVVVILLEGCGNHSNIDQKNIFRQIERKAVSTTQQNILKHFAPSSILSKEELIAARVSCWIQEYALTTTLSKELSECAHAKNKVTALLVFLQKLTGKMANLNNNSPKQVFEKNIQAPFKTESIAQKIYGHVISQSENENQAKTIHKDILDTLASFLIYITQIHNQLILPLQQKIDISTNENEQEALKKMQNELVNRLYDDVLLHQLADHKALIRNKKTAVSLALAFIFILGNIIVYSTFAVIGGKDLIEKTTHWLARYMSGLLSTNVLVFLQSPPLLFLYMFSSLFFGIPTLLVSWYFGGGAVKKFLTQLSLGDNRNPLKKNTLTPWLLVSGTLISAFGSNMLFFHYIATTFVATPLYFQIWLEFSIFVSTASLFIVLYTDSVKKYKEELDEFIQEQVEKKNYWQRFRIKIFSGISLLLIFPILCFVSVYADTISANRLLSSENTKFLNICYLHIHSSITLYLLIGAVGFFSAIFNIVYAFKAGVKFYEKLVNSLKFIYKEVDLQKKIEFFLLSAMIITAIVLISTQPHLSTLNLGLAIMTCFLCYIFYRASVKTFMLNKCIPPEESKQFCTTTLPRLFIIFLAIVLLSESIMIRTVWANGGAVATMYTPVLLTITMIIIGYICWSITSHLFSEPFNEKSQAVSQNRMSCYLLKLLQYILFAILSTSVATACFKNTYLGHYADYATISLFSFCITGIIIKSLLSQNIKQNLLEEKTIKTIETMQQIKNNDAELQYYSKP